MQAYQNNFSEIYLNTVWFVQSKTHPIHHIKSHDTIDGFRMWKTRQIIYEHHKTDQFRTLPCVRIYAHILGFIYIDCVSVWRSRANTIARMRILWNTEQIVHIFALITVISRFVSIQPVVSSMCIRRTLGDFFYMCFGHSVRISSEIETQALWLKSDEKFEEMVWSFVLNEKWKLICYTAVFHCYFANSYWFLIKFYFRNCITLGIARRTCHFLRPVLASNPATSAWVTKWERFRKSSKLLLIRYVPFLTWFKVNHTRVCANEVKPIEKPKL